MVCIEECLKLDGFDVSDARAGVLCVNRDSAKPQACAKPQASCLIPNP